MATSLRPLRLCLVAALFLALPAAAAVGRWTPFGPAVGEIRRLVPDPSARGVLFAVLENGRLYRSLDGGDSWGWSGQGLAIPVSDLVADPLDPDTLWAAGSTALFRSRDHGAHWTRASGDTFQPFPPLGPIAAHALLAVLPLTPRVLLFAGHGYGPVWRSADGGQTWSSLPGPQNLLFLKADRRGRVYANLYDGKGTWRSDDTGLHWRRLPGADAADDLAISPARPDTLYIATRGTVLRSRNGGAAWRTVLTAPEGSSFNAVATDPLDSRIVYLAVDGSRSGVWISTNGGESWRETSARDAISGSVFKMTVEPFRRTVYAVSHQDFASSRTFGKSWSHTVVSAGNAVSLGAGDRLLFDPRDPAHLAAVAGGNLFLSADGGRSWRAPTSGFGLYYGNLNDIAFDPVHPGLLYGLAINRLLLSRDGGKTWPLIANQGGLRLELLDRQVVLLAGEGIFRSPDHGHTWIEVLSGDLGDRSYRVCDRSAADPDPSGRVFVGCFSFEITDHGPGYLEWEMWQSTDRGLTWAFEPDIRDVLFDPAHSGTVFAMRSDGTLLRSHNGGTTWVPAGAVGSPGRPFFQIDAVQKGTLYALGFDGAVLRSRDSGATWTARAGGGWYDAAGFWVHPTKAGQLYARSTDGFFEMRFPS